MLLILDPLLLFLFKWSSAKCDYQLMHKGFALRRLLPRNDIRLKAILGWRPLDWSAHSCHSGRRTTHQCVWGLFLSRLLLYLLSHLLFVILKFCTFNKLSKDYVRLNFYFVFSLFRFLRWVSFFLRSLCRTWIECFIDVFLEIFLVVLITLQMLS